MNKYTPETLAQIDWEKMIEVLSISSHFDSTANTILQHNETLAHQEILDIFDYTQQWIHCIQSDDHALALLFSNLSPSIDLGKIALAISKNSIPTIQELNIIACTCENFLVNYNSLPLYYTSQGNFSHSQKSLTPFLKKIRLLIAKNGDLSFENLPEVKKAQEKISQIEKSIRDIIQRFITNPETNKALQYNNFDVIYDRYVLPIKSDSYNYQLGTIVARSETGKTLYVEPLELKQLANSRLELLNKIDEIINSYCLQCFELVKNNLSIFCKILLDFNHFDEFLTRARFAIENRLTKPNILKNKEIRLFNFFHPLIASPVKNDFLLLEEQAGLLISGPNMGGKTATLKAI